jgi:hypothetical protein
VGINQYKWNQTVEEAQQEEGESSPNIRVFNPLAAALPAIAEW